jgi:hypothetical protein
VRRFVLALLLSGIAVVLNQLPAHACDCVTASMQKHAQQAQAVFTAKVTRVERTSQLASYAVTVETVYKGSVRSQLTVQSEPSGAACGLENVVADRRYLFFGTFNGVVVQAHSCGGTTPVTEAATAQIVRILGEGSSPVGGTPTPPAPVYAQADTSAPASFSRLAAPGGALVIIGLLGLVLLRRTKTA